MNRFVMFSAALLLMCSMTGCCLLHGGGYGAGYGGYPGGGGGGCGGCGGGCGASPGGYPSAFAPRGPQAAFAPGFAPQTAFVGGYPGVAMDPLPTIIR